MPGFWLACFALSGAIGLVLQVVWMRELVDVFGSSTLAIATVLAAFMGGLALGATFGGRLADRLSQRHRTESGGSRFQSLRNHPLAFYAVAEITVGLSACAVPWLASWFRSENAALMRTFADWPALLTATRFVVAASVLLVPTTAMGATLPLLARHFVSTDLDVGSAGRRLGLLYSANTAGAVIGAAIAGFVWLQAFGVTGTGHLAAALAVSLGATALIVLFVRGQAPRRSSLAELAAEIVPAAPPPRACDFDRRLALVAYALSGAVAMALEVFWSRAQAIVIGSSVYTFTLVLVVFLIGISIGSAIAVKWLSRSDNAIASLAVTFAAMGLTILGAHQLADRTPALLLAMLERTALGVDTILALNLVVTGAVILPTAVALGAVMPLAMHVYVGSIRAVGRDVGRAYAANTTGAIVGSVVAGFWVLPAVGLDGGVRATVIISAVLAALFAWRAWPGRMSQRFTGLAAATAAAALILPGWNQSDLTAGLFRTQVARIYANQGGITEREVHFYRDGISTTVSVERLEGDLWTLKNNGKVEASDGVDMPTQILVGLAPVLVRPGAEKDVFVIGYGSGVTVGAIAQAPDVATIDVVELEPAVYEAADRFFSHVNHRPQEMSKVTRHLGDGRSFLLSGDDIYDVIVSEPSNPWIAGVSSLFTREFYTEALDHLSPDGVFCQWAQLYELGPRSVKMIYRTFASVFPYVYALSSGDQSTDTILLGSRRPLTFDVGALEARIRASGQLERELSRASISRASDFVSLVLLTPEEFPSFTAGAPVNTDDNTLLEFAAPRDLWESTRGNLFARSVRSPGWPYGNLSSIVGGLGDGSARADRQTELARSLIGLGRRREARAWLTTADGALADRHGATSLLFALTEPVEIADRELPLDAGGPPLLVGESSTATRALEHIENNNYGAAWTLLRDLDTDDSPALNHDIRLMIAYTAYKTLHLGEAKRRFERLTAAPELVRERPATLYYAGRTYYGVGMFVRGAAYLEEFARRFPDLAYVAAEQRMRTDVVAPDDTADPR